jgi:glycosyl hydrolase family 16
VKLGTAILGCAVLGLAVGSATAHISSRQQRRTAGTQPAPIAGKGYREVFRDGFTRLNRHVWDNHIWYDDRPSRAWKGFQAVEHGVLHLRTSRSYTYSGGRWPINTVTSESSGRLFRYGYFEARMRWTVGRGAWPGFWLLSYRHAANPAWPHVNPYCAKHGLPVARCYSAELDVFEGQGSDPRDFYGTVHRNSCNCYGVQDTQNADNSRRVDSALGKSWHTYSVLWTPTRITWYLDRHRLFSAADYDSTSQPMFLLLQMWVGGWTKDPDPSTPDPLDTQVDYVSVWQRAAR